MSDQIDVNQLSNALQQKVDLPSGKSQADIDYVVESQFPTAENNYTWYRLYKSGWVEQGGIWTGTITASSGFDGYATQNIPIAMADTNYCVNITNNGGTTGSTVWEMWCVQQLSTTSFDIHMGAYAGTRTITRMNWEVKGISAQS